MLLSPKENTALLENKLTWIQRRPNITQRFGENKLDYTKFGLKAHNGLDLWSRCGTPLFAPMDGVVKIGNSPTGYGLFVRIYSEYKEAEVVIAHLQKIDVKTGQKIKMGDYIGLSGTTGWSTGCHIHIGYRPLKPSKVKPVTEWSVLHPNNGYKGYIDVDREYITFKGTIFKNSLWESSP